MDYPIYKYGARWVCDGPEGRFHAKTKREAVALLARAELRNPPEPYWTVVWDYIGGDCGDLPWRFATEVEAIECGENWVAETLMDMRAYDDPAIAEIDAGGAAIEGTPVYHVVRHPREEVR